MWNRPADPDTVHRIALSMKPRDWKEFSCVSYCADRQSLAHALAERYGARPDCCIFGAGGDAIAVAGFLELRPKVVSLLFFSTDALPAITVPLTRFVRNRLFPALREGGAHRLECDTLDSEPEGKRWLETLGLRMESRMPCFGRDGETFARYAWTAGDAR